MKTLILVVYVMMGQPVAEVDFLPSYEKCLEIKQEIQLRVKAEIAAGTPLRMVKVECIQEAM